jgi:hypothetical protein
LKRPPLSSSTRTLEAREFVYGSVVGVGLGLNEVVAGEQNMRT